MPFSLETFTRPLYTQGSAIPTIVHENAHQWWGDNVSVGAGATSASTSASRRTRSGCGSEHNGADLDRRYRRGRHGSRRCSTTPLYDMGPGHEFDGAGVYLKGAFFMHALRNKIGDAAFFEAMRGIQRTGPVGTCR